MCAILLLYICIFKGKQSDRRERYWITWTIFNALHKIEMPLPPLAEQQRIVQKIEELFSVLDNIQKP